MTLVRANATKVVVVLIYTLAALTVFILNDKVIWDVGLVSCHWQRNRSLGRQ